MAVVLDLLRSGDQHAQAHGQQQGAQRQGGGRFVTLVTILVIVVGLLAAVMPGQQHHEIRDQVGERMDAVGNQGLRTGEHAGRDLQHHQYDIDHDADQRTDTSGAVARGSSPLKSSIWVLNIKPTIRA
jgi:hypothetical protein